MIIIVLIRIIGYMYILMIFDYCVYIMHNVINTLRKIIRIKYQRINVSKNLQQHRMKLLGAELFSVRVNRFVLVSPSTIKLEHILTRNIHVVIT